MKNALNNQVGMLGDMFLWLVANLKQGVIYFINQACGNDILASVYYDILKPYFVNNWFIKIEIHFEKKNVFFLSVTYSDEASHLQYSA